MFERGATDEFLVSSLEPMDELLTANVYMENCSMGGSWHLEVCVCTCVRACVCVCVCECVCVCVCVCVRQW